MVLGEVSAFRMCVCVCVVYSFKIANFWYEIIVPESYRTKMLPHYLFKKIVILIPSEFKNRTINHIGLYLFQVSHDAIYSSF